VVGGTLSVKDSAVVLPADVLAASADFLLLAVSLIIVHWKNIISNIVDLLLA